MANSVDKYLEAALSREFTITIKVNIKDDGIIVRTNNGTTVILISPEDEMSAEQLIESLKFASYNSKEE